MHEQPPDASRRDPAQAQARAEAWAREHESVRAALAVAYQHWQEATADGDTDRARELHERRIFLEARRLQLTWDRRLKPRAREHGS